jgi:hypothetical protein
MAFPTITNSPADHSWNSSLIPIKCTFSEYTSDTLNLIVQVQVWNGASMTPPSQYVDLGGKMRCASILNNAGMFYINVEDIANTVTEAHISHQQNFGNCEDTGTGFLVDSYTNWEYYGNRLIRIKVQREYLDATTGLIVVDPDTTTSDPWNVHAGVAPLKYNYLNLVGNWSIYQLGYDSGRPDRKELFYLTTAPRYRVPRKTTEPLSYNEYRYKLRTDEQLIVNSLDWPFITGANNRIRVRTYNANGSLLMLRNFTSVITNYKDGFHTLLMGPHDLIKGATPIVAEGVDFSVVSYYTIHWDAETSAGGGVYIDDIAARIRVDIDRTCAPIGRKRFAWRNQLGGWDMCSSNGVYKETKKIKRNTFQKRLEDADTTSLMAYGKNNWSNETIITGSVTTHAMKNREAMWFSEIGSSQLVYVQIFNDKYDPIPSFTDFEIHEDQWNCLHWVPIIITSNSIKTIKTDENHVKLEFSFQYAVNERFGRM